MRWLLVLAIVAMTAGCSSRRGPPPPDLFATPAFNVLASPLAAAAVDVNGDGKLDVIVRTATGFTTWLGQGDGKFASQRVRLVDQSAGSLAIGRFDSDGF